MSEKITRNEAQRLYHALGEIEAKFNGGSMNTIPSESRCPDGGIDYKGYYGHMTITKDMRLCADDQLRCQTHAREFDAAENRETA